MNFKFHKRNRHKFDFRVIFSLFSSFLLGSYALPVNALMAQILKEDTFLIAKTPDERPEAIEQGIQEIPPVVQPETPETQETPGTPQTPPTPETPEQPSPPSTVTPADAQNTTQPSNPAPAPAPAPAPGNTQPTRRAPSTGTTPPTRRAPSGSGTTRPTRPAPARPSIQPRNPQPVIPQEDPTISPLSPSREVNYRQLNYVDIALGVLAPGDYKFKGRHFHFYQFEGRKNQLIQIRLLGSADRRTSSNLSMQPLMYLLDPDGKVILRRGGGTLKESKDAFEFVRLPETGTYVVGVTTRNPGDTGRYSLALRNDRASYTVDEEDTLSENNPVIRKNGTPYKVSKFKGEKGQLVSIRVDSTFEEFSPYVVLLNSRGKIIATNNDRDGRFSALIDRAKLPEDDTYYVVVTSVAPRQTGAYRLTIF